MAKKVFKTLLWIQGLFTLLTALWGLIDIESFMLVTGPKNDIWLVKTVSAVLVAVACCLLSYLWVPSHPLPAILLGALTALGLCIIDVYYWTKEVISWVYLIDAAAEALFFITWFWLFFNRSKLME